MQFFYVVVMAAAAAEVDNPKSSFRCSRSMADDRCGKISLFFVLLFFSGDWQQVDTCTHWPFKSLPILCWGFCKRHEVLSWSSCLLLKHATTGKLYEKRPPHQRRESVCLRFPSSFSLCLCACLSFEVFRFFFTRFFLLFYGKRRAVSKGVVIEYIV